MKVYELLTFGGLQDAKVLAGEKGLSKKVESISVQEATSERFTGWIAKGQMHLSSFFSVRNDVEMQKTVIKSLHQCGSCGMILCHVGYFLKEIDPSLIEICNQLEYPLILADPDRSYMDIMNPINYRLIPKKEEYKEIKISTDLIDMITNDKDIREILSKFAFKLKRELSFFNTQMQCLYSNQSEADVERERIYLSENKNRLKKMFKSNRFEVIKDANANGDELIFSIVEQDRLYGYIFTGIGKDEKLANVCMILHTINLTCAILFTRKERVSNEEKAYQKEYFHKLITGTFNSYQEAIQCGLNINYDITQIHRFINIRFDTPPGFSEGTAEHPELNAKRWFAPKLAEIVKSYSYNNIIQYQNENIYILLAQPGKMPKLKDMTRELEELFESDKKARITIGVSSHFESVNEIPEAYIQAHDCAMLCRNSARRSKTMFFDQVGLFHFLKSINSNSAAVDFCKELIRPLEEFDTEKGTELVLTAKVLFDNNLDTQESANQLFVHRNTINYRKNQIIDVLGYNPFDFPYCINFYLALILIGK